MQPEQRKIFYPRFLFLNALLLVFIIATLPGKTPPVDDFTWLDKLFHAATFLILAILMRFANFKLAWWLDFIILFCFGVFIEFVQQFVPLRTADYFDILANAIGLIIFYLSYFVISKYKVN